MKAAAAEVVTQACLFHNEAVCPTQAPGFIESPGLMARLQTPCPEQLAAARGMEGPLLRDQRRVPVPTHDSCRLCAEHNGTYLAKPLCHRSIK